jgi:hypothetical protein
MTVTQACAHLSVYKCQYCELTFCMACYARHDTEAIKTAVRWCLGCAAKIQHHQEFRS